MVLAKREQVNGLVVAGGQINLEPGSHELLGVDPGHAEFIIDYQHGIASTPRLAGAAFLRGTPIGMREFWHC